MKKVWKNSYGFDILKDYKTNEKEKEFKKIIINQNQLKKMLAFIGFLIPIMKQKPRPKLIYLIKVLIYILIILLKISQMKIKAARKNGFRSNDKYLKKSFILSKLLLLF